MGSNSEKPEIVFFDVETTIPTRPGQGYALLEFGAMLVSSQKLIELENYSTLIRPADLSLITSRSISCNGITEEHLVSAPTFADVADQVYHLLHERIWAGHNILRFDCPRIREAFAEINRPAPLPIATIDSLALLTKTFGRRAGDMKMASLATYFGLGQQTHRSLDDVRMNFEVLKYCATVLLLESSLPDILTENCWVSPTVTKIRHNNGSVSSERTQSKSMKKSSTSARAENLDTPTQFNRINGDSYPMESLSRRVPNMVGHTDICVPRHEAERDYLPSDDSEEEEGVVSGSTLRESSTATESGVLIECKGNNDIHTQFNRINGDSYPMESLSRGVPNMVGHTDICVPRHEAERDYLPSDSEEEEGVVSGSTIRESSTATESGVLIECKGNNDIHELVGDNNATTNAFDMDLLRQELDTIHLPLDEEPSLPTAGESSNAIASEVGLIDRSNFLEPDKISLPSVSVIFSPYYRGMQKMHVLHKGVALHIYSKGLRVRFGARKRFVDAAGRTRLSFVVDAPPILCEILDTIDGLARKLSIDSNSSSEWRPSVSRKPGFSNSPTIRLHLPTMSDGNMGTELYLEESSATRRLVSGISDATEIDSFLTPGHLVDAYFSVDTYDYQQNAGIRLVAKKLIIRSC